MYGAFAVICWLQYYLADHVNGGIPSPISIKKCVQEDSVGVLWKESIFLDCNIIGTYKYYVGYQ